MMSTIAMSDTTMWGVGLAVGVLQFAFNVLFGLALAAMNRKTNRIDRLESGAEATARDLVDQRMATLGTHVVGLVDLLKQRVDQIVDRLKDGDVDMKELNARDHQLEIRFNARVEQLKDWARDTFATKRQADAMQRQIDAVRMRREAAQGSRADEL
jgi:hypothetical protein